MLYFNAVKLLGVYKMKYEKPEVRMFKFDVEDVITTSFPTTTTTTVMNTTTTVIYDDDFYEDIL